MIKLSATRAESGMKYEQEYGRYDIYTSRGHMTTVFNKDAAEKRYKQYCKDMLDGYSEKVELFGTDRDGKEHLIASCER